MQQQNDEKVRVSLNSFSRNENEENLYHSQIKIYNNNHPPFIQQMIVIFPLGNFLHFTQQSLLIQFMSRTSLGDPQKFELASIVTKNSRTGISSNRRLLVVKAGHLYYYSNIPKSFTGDNIKILQQFHELPKCSIQILHINRVNGFEPTSSYFSIQFQAKNMLQREDIRRTLVNEDYNFTPRNTRELVTWQFTCDNQFIKQRWVSALLHLKDYYKNEQLNMQKYFDTIGHEQPKSSNGSISSRSSLKVSPWRESVASRKSYTLDNNKYGLEFKDGTPKGSPKGTSERLEEPFLKKGRSQDIRNFQYPQFQMVIKEEQPRQNKIEEAFKVHQVKHQEPPKQQHTNPNNINNNKPPFNPPPPVIEEVIEQPSITQTPIKENSYSDSQDHIERRASMEKTLNDLKLFSETHRPYFDASLMDTPMPQANIPILEIVQEKPELKTSKISGDYSHTPRSNIDNIPSNQQERKEDKQLSSSHSNRTNRQMPNGSDFQWLFGQSCRGDSTFDFRIQKQKQLLSFVQSFKHNAITAFSDWLESKAKNQNRYRVSEQANRTKIVEIDNIQLRVAVLTTQNITINGKQKIFFNQDSIKNLKREFKIYQNLTRMLMKRLKHEPTLALRVPLALFIEYKGVTCIAFDRSENIEQVNLSDGESWVAEKSVLLQEGYKPEWFNFTTVNGFLSIYVKIRGKNIEKDQENLKEYLKRIIKVGAPDKNHNIIFQTPIDRTFLEVASKENASTSAESMERYVKGLKVAKGLQGSCPKQQIMSALEYCLFCKKLRKIYRSAQGEIDETHFFNLVFKGDPSIAPLLQQSNCPPLTNIHGQIFSFIQYYFGVILQIDQKVFTEYYSNNSTPEKRRKKDVFFTCNSSPLVRQYPFSDLQIIQSYSKLTLYLQTQHPLTQASIVRKKQIFHLKSENLPMSQSLQLLYDEACFFYFQSDFISCIKKCREYQQICPHQYTKLFAVYLLMMKAYSQFSEADFSLTLKKATELIEYNYGSQHSSLIALYSLAAFYYSKLSAKPNASKQIDLALVASKLLKRAQQLCLKHFGRSSKHYMDILLDLSRLHRRNDTPAALNYLNEAKKTCQENVFLSTPQNIISLQSYEAEFYLQGGNLPQAESALLNALALLDAKITPSTRKHLVKLEYQVGFYLQKYQYCEQAVQRLWEMDKAQKFQAIQLAYRAAMREGGMAEGEGLVDENDSVRFEGREKSLMELEREKTQHGSLVEMVSAAIQSRNTRLLTMIYFLSRI